MINFQEWVKFREADENKLWTIAVWTKHSPVGYMGIYHSEAEAFSEAMKEKQQSGYAGYQFAVRLVPEKYKDDLIKYGSAGPGM